MKKWIGLAVVIAVLIQACDKVYPPYMETNNTPTPTDSVVQKVIIEEFTGHLCPNCPEGSEVAHQLEHLYPGRVFIISIHAGYFANLQSPNYLTDYRCATGNELYNVFQPQSYPIAMINRISRNGSMLVNKDGWAPLVDSLIHTTPTIKIRSTKQFNPSTSTLQASLDFIFLQNTNKKIMWCAYITEDSLVSYQKNNNSAIGPTPDIPNFPHNDVLRGSINGTWGDTLISTPVMAGDTIKKSFQYSFGAVSWNLNQTHIIVFVYDLDTKQILQAEKFSVK
jgi:hypothetical protein